MFRALSFCLAIGLGAVAAPVHAQAPVAQTSLRADTLALFDAVGMEESFAIMVDTGRRDAGALADSLFPRRDGQGWAQMVDRLYTPTALRRTFVDAFPEDRMSVARAREILDFFTSDIGQRVVEGELTAWRAITDPEVEAAAIALYEQRQADGDPRIDLLSRMIASNDFVDLNVMAALNSNYAFLLAMSDGGAYERPIAQDTILRRVWQEEPRIREEATRWLYAFQLMAYDNLTDAELEAYIAFSESGAGQAYNSALFAGFDAVYTEMSGRLGIAAAQFMTGEPL